MKTFIFADRTDAGLQPLTDSNCAALLPVAGKTVIEYTLDDLARAGISEAVIVASAHADRVEAHLGKGERWGMQLDYFPSRGAEHPATLLRRYARDLEGPFLLIRGDVLRSSIVTFIENAAAVGEPLTEARIDGAAVGVCLCQAGIATLETLSWPYADSPGVAAPANPVELMDACWSALDSLAAYHRANLDVVANRYPGLKLAGWARENGLMVGRSSHVDNQSLAGEHAFVGRSTRVHPSARLIGTSVVNNNCFIDSPGQHHRQRHPARQLRWRKHRNPQRHRQRQPGHTHRLRGELPRHRPLPAGPDAATGQLLVEQARQPVGGRGAAVIVIAAVAARCHLRPAEVAGGTPAAAAPAEQQVPPRRRT